MTKEREAEAAFEQQARVARDAILDLQARVESWSKGKKPVAHGMAASDLQACARIMASVARDAAHVCVLLHGAAFLQATEEREARAEARTIARIAKEG